MCRGQDHNDQIINFAIIFLGNFFFLFLVLFTRPLGYEVPDMTMTLKSIICGAHKLVETGGSKTSQEKEIATQDEPN